MLRSMCTAIGSAEVDRDNQGQHSGSRSCRASSKTPVCWPLLSEVRMPAKKAVRFVINSRGCHVCISHSLRRGYPRISLNYKGIGIHRLVFEREYGPVPSGMLVCHSCDNKRCINPEHLFLGTNQDNKDDAVRKGRHARGGRVYGAKLTEKDCVAIRDSQESSLLLAQLYHVDRCTIWAIRSGRTWGSFGGSIRVAVASKAECDARGRKQELTWRGLRRGTHL